MTTKTSRYPLRLPASLKAAVAKLSKEDGTSIDQFVVMAVADKISAMEIATFFEDRKSKANRTRFRCILNRRGGELPSRRTPRINPPPAVRCLSSGTQ